MTQLHYLLACVEDRSQKLEPKMFDQTYTAASQRQRALPSTPGSHTMVSSVAALLCIVNEDDLAGLCPW